MGIGTLRRHYSSEEPEEKPQVEQAEQASEGPASAPEPEETSGGAEATSAEDVDAETSNEVTLPFAPSGVNLNHLAEALKQVDDSAVLLAMAAADQRSGAGPIYDARIRELA